MKNSQITQREKTIAHRYASGETYKEIASALFISPATVRNHMANVYRKLGVKNKPELLFALNCQQAELYMKIRNWPNSHQFISGWPVTV